MQIAPSISYSTKYERNGAYLLYKKKQQTKGLQMYDWKRENYELCFVCE